MFDFNLVVPFSRFALTSEIKRLVVKLDTLLGEDKLCMMKHDITRILGSSDPYTSNKQYQLLVRIFAKPKMLF